MTADTMEKNDTCCDTCSKEYDCPSAIKRCQVCRVCDDCDQYTPKSPFVPAVEMLNVDRGPYGDQFGPRGEAHER